MAADCPRCHRAREKTVESAKALVSGRIFDAARAARSAAEEVAAKISESERIRAITRRKPHG